MTRIFAILLVLAVCCSKAIAEPLPSPASLLDLVALDLERVPLERRPYARWLTQWPVPDEDREALENAMLFWLASLNNRRVDPPVRIAAPGLYRIYIDEYAWSKTAWEEFARHNPYWAVSTYFTDGTVRRGWVDPIVEYSIREQTCSTLPISRADHFIARTSLEVGNPRSLGFYSRFKDFPATEAQLLPKLGVDQKFVGTNHLAKGGAVLKSIVALHNRELQLLPSLWGDKEKFVWRSLDMLGNTAQESVVENFLGTVKFAGKEFIGTNLNDTHWYYLANAQGNQVDQVPAQIAQDTTNPHDAIVYSPWKCVSCHGPQAGIRHFDDVISRMALDPRIGLATITKQYYPQDPHAREAGDRQRQQVKEELEDYYMSELAGDIAQHQHAYGNKIREINGLSPSENAENYVGFVTRYLYGYVTKQMAARELGIDPNYVDHYLLRSGNEQLLTLAADQAITREAFEKAYADGMRSRMYPWERKPLDATQLRKLAVAARPVDPNQLQPQQSQQAVPTPSAAADPPGSKRYRIGTDMFYVAPDGRRFVWDGGRWISLDERGRVLQ